MWSFAGLLAGALPSYANPGQDYYQRYHHASWARVATDGGALVDVEVLDRGTVKVSRYLCALQAPLPEQVRPAWKMMRHPVSGSQVVGFLRQVPEAGWLFIVPDASWTRWTLSLSDAYREAVCQLAAGQKASETGLRKAWIQLLDRVDQRARDEASRLAADFPHWANDLSEPEVIAIFQTLAVFPVNDAEADRWLKFLVSIPPGPVLAAVLNAADGSTRPFFRLFLNEFRRRRYTDPAFMAFCAVLRSSERPELCPPQPDRPEPGSRQR